LISSNYFATQQSKSELFSVFAAQKFGIFRFSSYLCSRTSLRIMNTSQVIENIRQVAARVLPKGSTLYLYGSRARGDYHEDSDWDLLLLLDKPKLEQEDFDKYSYPFVLMGWDMGADIRPHAYTKEEWFNGPHALFYFNVEKDKEVIYES
jgi:predicted nucleotidyltransferase